MIHIVVDVPNGQIIHLFNNFIPSVLNTCIGHEKRISQQTRRFSCYAGRFCVHCADFSGVCNREMAEKISLVLALIGLHLTLEILISVFEIRRIVAAIFDESGHLQVLPVR